MANPVLACTAYLVGVRLASAASRGGTKLRALLSPTNTITIATTTSLGARDRITSLFCQHRSCLYNRRARWQDSRAVGTTPGDVRSPTSEDSEEGDSLGSRLTSALT